MSKFVLSKKKLLEQFDIVSGLADYISYSAKTNYEVGGILELETDCFFSIHTIESISRIKDKKRIWFFLQASDLKKVFSYGIENFVVDNKTDLNYLLEFIQKNNKKINLLLRMRLREHTIHTGKYFVFGMYSYQINKLIPELRKNININRLGIHFHRKTQNISEWNLVYELKDSLTPETFQSIDLINIGGGIPVNYKNLHADVGPIFEDIKKLRVWLKNIKLIVEPGRFIAAPCIKLVTSIKNIYDNNIIIDCSVYNSVIDTFATHHRLGVEGELENGKAYVIKGETPCSMDIFRYSVFLRNPKVGDRIVFLNAGAYNFCSDFCDLKKIPTEIID